MKKERQTERKTKTELMKETTKENNQAWNKMNKLGEVSMFCRIRPFVGAEIITTPHDIPHIHVVDSNLILDKVIVLAVTHD